MKQINLIAKIQLFFYCLFMSIYSYAQEGAADLKIDVDVNEGGNDWLSNPLVWVIGGLVLIIIVALIARGGNK